MKRTLYIIILLAVLAIISDYWRIIFPNLEKVEILNNEYHNSKTKLYDLKAPYLTIQHATNYIPSYYFTLYQEASDLLFDEKTIKTFKDKQLKTYQLFDKYPTNSTYNFEMEDHFGETTIHPIFIGASNLKYSLHHLFDTFYEQVEENIIHLKTNDTILIHYNVNGNQEHYSSIKIISLNDTVVNVTILYDYDVETRKRSYYNVKISKNFLKNVFQLEEQFKQKHNHTPNPFHVETITIIVNNTYYKTYTSEHRFHLNDWFLQQFSKYKLQPAHFEILSFSEYSNPYL